MLQGLARTCCRREAYYRRSGGSERRVYALYLAIFLYILYMCLAVPYLIYLNTYMSSVSCLSYPCYMLFSCPDFLSTYAEIHTLWGKSLVLNSSCSRSRSQPDIGMRTPPKSAPVPRISEQSCFKQRSALPVLSNYSK